MSLHHLPTPKTKKEAEEQNKIYRQGAICYSIGNTLLATAINPALGIAVGAVSAAALIAAADKKDK